MDREAEFSFRYVSPSIVRGEPHEFCLEYSDAQGKPYFRYLDRSLRHDTLYRSLHPFIAGLITGARTSLLTRVGKVDLAVAVGIALLLLVIVVGTGDPLQFGFWYYLLIPALLVSFGVFLGAPSPYLTGAALAATVSLLIVWSSAGAGGLIGLGHLFSLPLAIVGHVIGLSSARRGMGVMAILALGCLGWGGGFLLTQMLMCRRGFERFFCEFSIFS